MSGEEASPGDGATDGSGTGADDDAAGDGSVVRRDRFSGGPARGFLSSLAADERIFDADLAVECVECGNTVTAEGESARIDGTLYHFCCDSCRENFEERFDRIEEGA